MEIERLDQAGLDFIIKNEGVVLHPYKDSNGTPTIGVGFTWYPDTGKKVTMLDNPLTMTQCMKYFSLIVRPFENCVASHTKGMLTQNQFNACVDFTYEEGVGAFAGSSLLQLILHSPNDPAITTHFLVWDKEHKNGVLVENLDIKARRQRDADLYFKH